jgi:threonylcarbamoyladenosine tRNA methylthiotransferase MtaB
MAKVSFYTIGCKLNQYETELMAEKLEALGFERVEWAEDADLYIINSCMVTQRAAADSRRKMFAARKKSPHAKIVITGCYAQIERDKLAEIGNVDLVVGNDQKGELIYRLSYLFPEIAANDLTNCDNKVRGFYKHTRALIKIQDGCNQKCSYCVIPLGRGSETSRASAEIIEEIKLVAENGFKEIVLTGVHIGRYNNGGTDLTGLLRLILDQADMERIRLSSLEVNEIDAELIELAAQNKRLCPHFHIPLQSGSDRILRAMKRPYQTARYLEIVTDIKERLPRIMIGADVIVGFPGEGETEFEETMTFVENSPIDYLHVFSYSDHPQAASFQFAGKVLSREIKNRNSLLTGLGDLKWRNFLSSQLERELPVLIEKRLTRDSGMLTGLSDNYMRVECEGSEELFNSIRMVKPVELSGRRLLCKLV